MLGWTCRPLPQGTASVGCQIFVYRRAEHFLARIAVLRVKLMLRTFATTEM